MSLLGLHKFGWPKSAIDLALHAVQGGAVVAAGLLVGWWAAGAVAGFWRELSQYRRSGSPNLLDRAYDVAGFALGGALVGWLL